MKKSFKLIAISFLLLAFANSNAQTVNWAKDIAPILYNNCGSCHIPGALSTLNLVGYSNAKNHGFSIYNKTVSREMPPWPANPDYKRYAHEKLLSGDEIQAISDWVYGGMPSGDTTKAPAPPTLPKGSLIVNPSLKLKMPDYVATTVDDEYRCFVMPTGLTTDQYLTQIEVIPGNQSAVHHVIVFHDTSKIPLNLDLADPNPGYVNFGGTGSNTSTIIGLWVPGQEPFYMPSGAGIKLLKKGYIIFQVHYPKGLKSVLDSTKVFMKLSAGPLREVAIASPLSHGATLTNGPLFIPANTTKTFYENYNLTANVSVFAVAPHMHLIGQHIKSYGVVGTDTTPFIDIPDWDFHWQRTYVFPKIQKLPTGMKLKAEAFYDNTVDNPSNPSSPPKNVSVGERTTDEMMLVFFWYMLYQAGDENIVIDTSSQKNLVASVVNPKANTIETFYPVPANDILHIQLNAGIFKIENLQVFATDGKLICTCKPAITAGQIHLSTKDLKPGIYVGVVHQAGGISSFRFLKE
jgi:hypothetical protein